MDFWTIMTALFAASIVMGYVEHVAQGLRKELRRIEAKLDHLHAQVDRFGK